MPVWSKESGPVRQWKENTLYREDGLVWGGLTGGTCSHRQD